MVNMDLLRKQEKIKRAEEIIKEMKRYEVSKNKHKESFCHIMKNHEPNVAYLQAVDKDKQVSLPIIRKIKDGKLILKDYTLDTGHLNGLAAAVSQTAMKLDSVLFDNCGIDDQELAVLL